MTLGGSMHSTPTAGMEVMLNIPPLDTFMQMRALNDQLRQEKHNQWRWREGDTPWNKSHAYLTNTLKNTLKNLIGITENTTKTDRTECLFSTEILNREELQFPKRRPRPYTQNTTECFTDGSKSGDKCGAGYITWNDSGKKQDHFPLGKHASVFQAEILAISEAASSLLSDRLTNNNINFHIDSQSAIKALSKYQSNNILVIECKNRLNQLCNDNKVSLNWIPGHEGHMGNEVADRLAKAGADSATLGPVPLVPVPRSVNKHYITEWGTRIHQNDWGNRTDCRQSKIFMPKVDTKMTNNITDMDKHSIRILTQMITGHAKLNRHKHLMGLEDSPTCPKCGVGEETPHHMLTECPAYGKLRLEIFNKLDITTEDIPLLKGKAIVRFARGTGRWTDR